MAVPAKSPLRIVVVLVVVVLCGFGLFSLLNGDTEKPAGIPDDASTLRFVTKSGDDKLDMETVDGDFYTFSVGNLDIRKVDDPGRDFLSRDRHDLWLRQDTADSLGLDWDELLPTERED